MGEVGFTFALRLKHFLVLPRITNAIPEYKKTMIVFHQRRIRFLKLHELFKIQVVLIKLYNTYSRVTTLSEFFRLNAAQRGVWDEFSGYLVSPKHAPRSHRLYAYCVIASGGETKQKPLARKLALIGIGDNDMSRV